MATQNFGFEQLGQNTPPLEYSDGEREGKALEVVQAATSQEIVETLDAGADVVVSQDFELQTVRDATSFGESYVDHARPARIAYVAGSKKRMDEILATGLFADDWKVDANTYKPYVCIKKTNARPLTSVYHRLNAIFGEQVTLDMSGTYIWNKKRDQEEKGTSGAI
jgi:hypothetical protein